MAEDFGELQLLFHAGRLTTLGRPAPHWWRADTSLTVRYTVCLQPTRLTHRTLPCGKETLPF
jgi:hypothetical protein